MNQNPWCYVVDGIHLKVIPANFKIWSMAINSNETDLETCPLALAKTLMPAKSTQKNPFRELASKPVEKASEVVQHPALPPGANPLLTPYTPVSYHPFGHPYLPPPYLHP